MNDHHATLPFCPVCQTRYTRAVPEIELQALRCDSCKGTFHCRRDVTVLFSTWPQGSDPALRGRRLMEVAGHA